MSELRQDPVTLDWVIVAPERASRPRGRAGRDTACPFCPGNEHMTPPPVASIDGADGRWLVRSVPNKFAALVPDASLEADASGWRRVGGFGHHEVIVETPGHESGPERMPVGELRLVLEMYLRRYRALATADTRLRQIVIFRNRGRRAGTSLEHPHSQIIAVPTVAPETRRRVAEEIEHFDATGRCGACHVLGRELELGQRTVLETDAFVTVAPFAPRGDDQLQIVPRRHVPTFAETTPPELDDLAAHLSRVLRALRAARDDPDYNLIVHTPPLDLVHRGANHWLIEILPRLSTPAGFELGSRIPVTLRTPEDTAAALRRRLRDPAARP